MKDKWSDFIKENMDTDIYFRAECSLLEFTETVCKIHGQYRGIYLIYYHVLEWVADKLLWRTEGPPK